VLENFSIENCSAIRYIKAPTTPAPVSKTGTAKPFTPNGFFIA